MRANRALLVALKLTRRGHLTTRLTVMVTAVAMIVAVPVSLGAIKRSHQRHRDTSVVMRHAPLRRSYHQRHISPGIRYGFTRTGFRKAPARAQLSWAPRLAAHAAIAHTYTVNSTADTSDATPGDGVCADGSGNCTLRAAIEEANADSGPTQINVPAGTYTLSNGELNPTADMFITGAGAGSTIVNQTTSSSRVFDVTGGATEISGMTISGGNGANGAGLYVTNAGLTLASDTVSGNNAGGGYGAGVYVAYSGALWMSDGALQGNTTTGYGGGLYNDGRSYLRDSTIGGSGSGQGNSAYGGAGIYVTGGNMVADNITVQGNTATSYGGGVYNDGSMQLNGGSITGNVADRGTSGSGYGGGVYNDYTLAMTGTTVSNNLARGTSADAGGIYTDDVLQLTGSDVTGNQTQNTTNHYDSYGGGIDNEYDLQMTGGSITGNTATYDSSVSGVTGGYVYGGGLYNDGDNATVDGVSIKGNTVNGGDYYAYGGGLMQYYVMALKNSTVDNNTATGRYVYGGGMYTDDYTTMDTVKVNGNTANATSYAEGGGVDHEYYAQMRNVTIDSNTAKATGFGGEVDGGGLYLYYGSNLDNVWVTNTIAQAPDAGNIYGGGVYNDDSMTMDKSGVVGTNATAGNSIEGAGFYINYYSTITRSAIANNTGDVTGASGTSYGGAVYENDQANYINDTIANNSVTASGGGTADYGAIYISDYPAQMTNDTVAGNQAGTNYGGLYPDSGSALNIKNAIVSGNTSASVVNCGGSGTINSAGNNLESADTCGFHNAGDQINTDPKLGPLQDNGGSTLTMAELTGSPAIDAGTNNGCPATDQRGVSRPQGAACDIGAYEAAAASLSLTKSAPAAAVVGYPFGYTITVSNNGPGPSTGTTLVDQLPAGETSYGVNPSQGTCTSAGSPAKITCSLGNIENGSSATVKITVAEANQGNVTNTARVTNDQGASVSSSATTSVYPARFAGAAPTAVTGAATGIQHTAATLSGSVNPGGETTAYVFQYGTTSSYGSASAVHSTGTSPQNVSGGISGLALGTLYHYRLIAINADGSSFGADHTFRTTGFLGSIVLNSRSLTVKNGRVSVSFTCRSSLDCFGLFSITVRTFVAGKHATVECTKSQFAKYSIGAGKRKVVRIPVHDYCISELQSHSRKLNAKLTTRPRTNQQGLIKLVKLFLK